MVAADDSVTPGDGNASGDDDAPPSPGPDPDSAPGYRETLQLDVLLNLQPETVTHDELMFYLLHQVHELWFKLILFELEEVRDLILDGTTARACHLLRRCEVIVNLLAGHWSVLDTMLPQDYLAFRNGIQGKSGFESSQYREIEFLAGEKDPGYLERVRLSAGERARLQARLTEPSLREAFDELLADRDVKQVADVFRDEQRHGDLVWLAERLVDFDEAFAQWRARHVLMVERQIGHKPGTGGSSGTEYLRRRLHIRFFPQLWQARDEL